MGKSGGMPIIVDEICQCGHKKSEHNNTPFEKGHGSCKKCSCSKFTFKDFVFGDQMPEEMRDEDKETKILKGLAGYIAYGISTKQSFLKIISELAHDIGGIIHQREGFTPRTIEFGNLYNGVREETDDKGEVQ